MLVVMNSNAAEIARLEKQATKALKGIRTAFNQQRNHYSFTKSR